MMGAGSGCRQRSAFSLVELLGAVSIAVLLLALIGPAFANMANAGKRRAAVIKVLNLMESARVTALSTSAKTYLGFADADFPDPEQAYRQMILFRDHVEYLDGPQPAGSGHLVRVLGKWEHLPDGIAFYDDAQLNSIIGDDGHTVTISSKTGFPSMPNGGTLKAISWNSTGMIEDPADPAAMQLILFEGFYKDGQVSFTRNAWHQTTQAGLFDQIQLSRFSGRAQLVVDSL